MDIRNEKISSITPYENNPRTKEHSAEMLKKSIQKFGFLVPIVVDKNGVVIAGHSRLEAAQALGMEEVPTIKAEDLTEAQAKALRVVDNKTQELSRWDFDLLDRELQGIKDLDMGEFGFVELGTGEDLLLEDAGEDERDEAEDFGDEGLFEEAERLFETFRLVLSEDEARIIDRYANDVKEPGERFESKLVRFIEEEFLDEEEKL